MEVTAHGGVLPLYTRAYTLVASLYDRAKDFQSTRGTDAGENASLSVCRCMPDELVHRDGAHRNRSYFTVPFALRALQDF